MKKIVLITTALLLVFALAACASTSGSGSTAAASGKPVKVFLVGDSTVSSFNDPYYYPRYGYGTKIGDYLQNVEVVNYALSGRSSKSFLMEMNYRKLKNEIGKGDFLIIGFGHNDEKNDGERYTNPKGAVTDPASFKYHLYEHYIKLARDAKATPILATPIVRRSPENAYTGSVIHQTKDIDKYPGGDYAQTIRDLAKEMKVDLIDNTAMTKELYEKLGPDATLKLHAWLKHKPDSVDNTHLNAYGASYVAYLMADNVSKSKSKLAKYVKAGITAPVEALVLEKNPSYVIPKYETPTASDRSALWTTTDPWRGTVFGDMGGAEKILPDAGFYEIAEKGGVVAMRSGKEDGTSVGKIASSSDGLAFYFQMIPIAKDFTIKAKATVKFAYKNNQVSFGLMVRDDVYFDKFDNSIKSNYVAAGVLGLAGDVINTSFARVDGALARTAAAASAYPAPGTVIDLSITKKGDEYTVKYGNEAPVTYKAALNEVDKGNVFAGLYTVRCAAVDFSDITLTVQ